MGLLKSITSNSRIAQTIFLGFVFSALFSLQPGFSQASDPVVFQSFDFGVLRGQVAHEAFVPISGEPVSGVSQSVVGTLTGSFNTAQFRLVSLTGGVLQTLNLGLSFTGGSPSGFGEFTGSFIPPDQPFQVGVSGLDTSGNSYDIVIAKIFTPQPVEVVFDRTTLDKSGNTSTLFIDVTNHGNSGTFLVNASDIAIEFSTENPRGELSSFITRVSPLSLSLSSGNSGGIEIDITPSSGAPIDTGVILTVEVVRSGDPNIYNRDVLTFPVVIDKIPPTVNPPSNVTVSSTGSLTPVAIGQATATDDLGVFSLSSNSDGLFPVGTTEVTWVALDAAGNLGTAIQIVTVTGSGNDPPVDTVPPNITPPPDVTVQATGEQTTVDIGTAAATDDVSSSANIVITNNAPATFSVGVTSVKWTATDEAGNSATATQIVTVTDTGGNGQTVLDIQVTTGSDDAEERADGGMSLTSSDLEFTFDSGGNQTVGMRFNGLSIPSGATITNATIQFQVDEVSLVDTSLTIRGENNDNPFTFIKVNGNITSRPLTAASVPWVPNTWPNKGKAGPDQQTPDIKSVIQEIVNLPGWASGNSLAIIISGTGERTAESFDGVASAAPKLHIEFVTGSPQQVTVLGSPQQVTVPNVVGLTQADATTTIIGAGLILGSVTTQSSATVTAGSVISQNPITGASVVPGSAVNIVVSFEVTAVPVILDIQIGLGSDDAEENSSGKMNLTSSDLELVFEGSSNQQKVGMRFLGLNIPIGATVTKAYVQFQVDEKDSGETSLTIQGEGNANPSTFTTSNNNITSRSVTAASVSWVPNAWPTVGEVGLDQQTPDISSIIQEIIKLSGWASGNPLAIIISGTGERTAESFNGDSSGAPRLHVEFVTGSPQQVTVPNVVGQTQGSATTALTGVGLVLGRVTTQSSASVAAGNLISQNPVAGTSVVAGSSVDIVVSSGLTTLGILDIRVSASSDDAEERADGSMSLTSSDLEFTFNRGSNQTVGMRFNGVSIPNCSTITNAYIQFQVDEVNTGATSLTIQGEDNANPSTFTTSNNNITSRSVTTASVSWTPVPWTSKGEAGLNQQTPNLSSIIEEIVNLPGWASGNSLAVLISGTGERTAESFNGDSSAAPRLHLEYVATSCN